MPLLACVLWLFLGSYHFIHLNLSSFSDEVSKYLEVGDIVLRHGLDADSFIIAKFSGEFSHIGIAISKTQIIHSTTNDNPKKKNQVIISSLENFLKNANKVAIVRLNATNQSREKIANYALDSLGIPFSLSENGMYCSTFVESAIKSQINIEFQRNKLDLPFFSGEFLYPDSIYKKLDKVYFREL
ncbi:MAG: YiiX/YebB-like N1pC/P60 family cysteine hydrolase [Helicobacter sp.]|nr:YiiX/YebB-like N1pC/P60 family cysteine hydrolase [Helicobacteraceae bacterium]MDY3112950.1 YiiX/YebB-like N1pC/P60 family cysteine hydrolase [Helicobacter sp.]